ncbi:MAG: amino acid adenylation domain-containing protein, partial [Acidimicrobiia bacterium]|nr:amino acid adenylation domain-containing protein [Acidimicrobiia bacterium]
VTGLSRGQFFETRLTPAQFSRGGFDPAAIDQTVLEARKAYHRENDAVSRLLDVSIFATDDVFERIEFVDYYRYTDVELDEMLSFLAERAPWIRPADTGRSTNCLVNAAGIHVHRLERGFHNYALPYSWDVRLGHKTRAEAVEELDDPIVTEEVDAMLAEIGYRPRPAEILTGWYVAAEEIEPDELRRHLARLLPAHAVPSAFVRVDAIPLNDNGKVAVGRLPAPDRTQRLGDQEPAATETEEVIAGVWARVLGLEAVSVTAPFFDQGGTSLRALEMIVAVSEAVGTEIPERLAFRHRTVRDLATVVDELLREAVDRGEVAMVPVVSDRSSGPLPLSVGEETLLFHARSHPDDVRYNVTRLYTIEGSIDPDRLVDAVATVVEHHQPLHTSYGPDRRDLGIEESLQVIRRSMPDDQAVREWAEGEKSRPFDLVNGPLVRLGLGDVGPDRWAALVAVPHIVADAGALDVFWEQVAAAYDGEEPPPLPLTYAALADQHRTRHRQDRTDARFWRTHREGRDRAPFLAVERPVPPEPDGYVHRALDRCASDLAQGPGRTAFSVALAAFSVVLQRHGRGGEPEVAVTSSIRDHPDAERLVGYFLNPLPVRVRAEPADSFAAVCARADEAIADALAHRTYPYAWMVRDARAEGATAPPVDVMLAYEDLVPPRLGEARVEHQILASGRAVTDLTGFVQVRGQSVELGIEYSGSVMGQAAARRLLDDFAAVIEAGLDDPHRPVGALRPGESILAGPDLGPIEHVGPLVDAHPAMAPAVRCGTVSLDYGRLRARRDELATVLAAHDVAVGHRVGLVLRRSTDAVAAMLACWQVGAAYVPIDPTQPLSRIRALVEAVAPSVVLVDDRASWSEPIGTSVVLGLDQPPGPTTPVVDARPGPGAYVIFTSGTTGRPKAVEITHENLAASMAARRAYFPDRPDRFLMVSAFSFDSSMVGLHWTLAEGGEVVLPTEDEVHDPDRLVDLIGEAAVTHTLMVPSLYGAVLARGDARRLRSLATVIVAGEACPADLVGRHHRVIDAELVNEYGPTETTIWATAHRCRADERTVPIGRPISGVTVAVMDAFGEVVPAGVAGELWISGPTVADGYLTGEDGGFVVREGQRWYRTGDRVRTAPDAEHLLFLGRVDEQLSLGGRRVEPGEIEQHLMTHPGVHRAAVGLAREPVAGFDALRRIEPADVSALLRQAADEDDPASALAELVAEDAGPGVLVALLEAGPDVDPVRVREQLATVLPAALVPRRISLVADLPLLPNGKLDRSAVDWSAARTSEKAPRPSGGTETTRAVVESFRTAFADPTIDDDSDFFDLGGDSLLAVALAANLEELLGRTIPINALVDARTPARLAAALEPSGLGLVADDLLVPLRRSGTATPLLAISPGGGHVLGYEPLVQALPMDIPVWGLRLPGSDSREQPAATVEALVDRFEREVSTRFPVGPLQLVGFSTGGLGAYELARCLARRGRTVELVVLIDTVFPGRQHAVSDRRQRVRDLLAQRDLRALVADAWDAAHRRGSPLWAGVRRRWSAARGTTVSPTLNEAYLYRAAHRAATAYRPGPYDGPVLVVRASQTDPELTSTPWTTLAPAARVEVVDGSHFGDGGLMRGEPVRRIARLIAGATTDLS